MKPLSLLNQFRDRAWERTLGAVGNDLGGCFRLFSPIDRGDLRIIAGNGDGWDHVSVSRANRCPNWPEMEHVKRLFFYDDECAMQLHVPAATHVNYHDYCLHIWRPHGVEIPRPPSIMVGPSTVVL